MYAVLLRPDYCRPLRSLGVGCIMRSTIKEAVMHYYQIFEVKNMQPVWRPIKTFSGVVGLVEKIQYGDGEHPAARYARAGYAIYRVDWHAPGVPCYDLVVTWMDGHVLWSANHVKALRENLYD